MNDTLEAQLYQEYPAQFAGVYKDLRTSLIGFGCECGDGWYKLITNVCALVAALHAKVEWVQIKEKFGGLRMYHRWVTPPANDLVGDLVFHLVDTAEQQSLRVCEQCGETKDVTHASDHGWWRTECEGCKKTRQEKRNW